MYCVAKRMFRICKSPKPITEIRLGLTFIIRKPVVIPIKERWEMRDCKVT